MGEPGETGGQMGGLGEQGMRRGEEKFPFLAHKEALGNVLDTSASEEVKSDILYDKFNTDDATQMSFDDVFIAERAIREAVNPSPKREQID